MADTLKLQPNPVVVYEYKDYLVHTLQRTEHLSPVRDAVNLQLVGTKKVNIVKKDGRCVANPKVEKHPNYEYLKDAHWLINASVEFPVIIRVYSDGHRECIPCTEDDDKE